MSTQPSKFSQWIRLNLKDSFGGLIAQDIDFIIKNKNGRLMVVEEKIFKNARTGPAQAIIYKLIDEICSSNKSFEGVYKITDISNGYGYVNQHLNLKIQDFIDSSKEELNLDKHWYENVIELALPYLWDCKGTPKVGRNTARERTFNRNSNLIPLLIKNEATFTSIDWIFVNYCSGYFAFFHELEPTDLTLEFVEIFNDYNYADFPIENPKSREEYKFLGNFTINHSTDFSRFYINKTEIQKQEAVALLNLEDDSILQFL